jgi:hypothetical protein
MTTTTTVGRSADLSESDEIIKRARTFIEPLLENKPFSERPKKELANFLEEVIKSRQQVAKGNQPGTTTGADQVNDVANRFNAIEQKLDELKAITETNFAKFDELKTVVTTTSERTYAQVAAAAATPDPSIHIRKHQQAEEAKRERAKFQFTLSTKSVSEEAKKELDAQHLKVITARCQHAIDKSNLATKPKVQGINPPKNNQLRLQFKTAEEIQGLQEVDWNEAYEGLTANKTKYGVVIHGVAKSAINLTENHDETIKEWERDNESKGIKIVQVIPLRRERGDSEGETSRKHHSIVVFTHDAVSADHCIRFGFFIDKLHHKTARYAPNYFLIQCYNCHEWGHRASTCKRKKKCGKCTSEDHAAVDCTSTELTCMNCKGQKDVDHKHVAWDIKCPSRVKENQRLTGLKKAAWPYFTDTFQ